MKIVERLPKLGKKPVMFNTFHFISLHMLLKSTEEVATHLISFKTKKYFPVPFDGRIYLTYPLGCVVEVECKKVVAIGQLCHVIARAYAAIYQREQVYGVYGHELNHLCIEGLELYRDSIIIPHIGS